jgi:hypothetical protein
MGIERTSPFAGMDIANLASSFGAAPAAPGAPATPGTPLTGAVPTAPATPGGAAPAGDWNLNMNHQEATINAQGANMIDDTASLNSKGEASLVHNSMSFGNGAAPLASSAPAAPVVAAGTPAKSGGMSDMMQQFGQKMRDTIMGSFDKMLSGMFGGKGAATPAAPAAVAETPAAPTAVPAASTAIAADPAAISTPAPAAGAGAPVADAGGAPAPAGNSGAPAAPADYAGHDAAPEAAAEQQAAPSEGGRSGCGGHHGHHDGGEGAPGAGEGGPVAEAPQPSEADGATAEAEPQYDAEYMSDSFSGDAAPGAAMPWDAAAASEGAAPASAAPAALAAPSAASPAPVKNGGNNFNYDRDEFQMNGDQMQMTRWHADYSQGAAQPAAAGVAAAPTTTASSAARDSFNLRREQFTLKPRLPVLAATTTPALATPTATPALAAPAAAPAAPNAELFARFFPAKAK